MSGNRLKVVCLVSAHPGHIDFGGLGFVKLARAFLDRGHDVTWWGANEHRDRLTQFGFRIDTRFPVDALRLYPLLSQEHLHTQQDIYQARLTALAQLFLSLRGYHPDLLLIDRILALGPLLAANLGIPAAVIGTNGEYCMREGQTVVTRGFPVGAYQEVGETIKRHLGWEEGSLHSFWGQSPYANITFLGNSFYRGTTAAADTSWYVHHFDTGQSERVKMYHGFSFGHSGDAELMCRILDALLASGADPKSFKVFCGAHEETYRRYAAHSGEGLEVYRWVPFSDHLRELHSLTFFGGIGTLWHCINSEITMIMVPGGLPTNS